MIVTPVESADDTSVARIYVRAVTSSPIFALIFPSTASGSIEGSPVAFPSSAKYAQEIRLTPGATDIAAHEAPGFLTINAQLALASSYSISPRISRVPSSITRVPLPLSFRGVFTAPSLTVPFLRT